MTKEQYLNQRNSLMVKAKGFLDSGDLENFNATKQEVEDLDSKYEAQAAAQANYAAMQGSAVVAAQMQDLGMPQNLSNPASRDLYDSDEYRTAFMNFACRGEAIPAKFTNQAASTSSTDAGAVIPTTMLKEIIRNLKERGVIFQKVRRLNVPAGVEIPILDLAPKATWSGENASEDQKISAKNKIAFKYYGLECKIAQSILVSIVSLDEFQSLFVELATEAVIAEIEKCVFVGTGSGQMLGVTKDSRVTNIVELTDAEISDWSAWKKKVFAKIPKRYQNGEFHMSQGTFEGQIDGMVDKNGQPVARVNYGMADAPQYRFGGKNVNTVESDVLPDYDTADNDAVVAVYMNLKDYIVNTSMNMTVVQWIDNDTNQKKTKVMLICDGKPGDTTGIILVKKNTT